VRAIFHTSHHRAGVPWGILRACSTGGPGCGVFARTFDEEFRLTEPPRQRTGLQQFLLYWLPLLLYVTVILTLSAQPNLKQPFPFENGDKLCHLIEYGGLGILLARLLRGALRVRFALVGALIAIAVGSLIGAGDEYFQSYIPGRDSSVYDWMADTTGVMLAQIAFLVATRIAAKKS
jgi:VanZ family protein